MFTTQTQETHTQKHNINHNTTLVCSTLHHTTRHVFVHNTALEHNRAHTHTDTIDSTKKAVRHMMKTIVHHSSGEEENFRL